jgi:hypothetical protein
MFDALTFFRRDGCSRRHWHWPGMAAVGAELVDLLRGRRSCRVAFFKFLLLILLDTSFATLWASPVGRYCTVATPLLHKDCFYSVDMSTLLPFLQLLYCGYSIVVSTALPFLDLAAS